MVYRVCTLKLDRLIGPVEKAGRALTRLDERLARSPVRAGWIERSHFHDAAAALWIEGELIHVEDLVLHDAHMDIRAPTHELTRAHAVLRARRQIFGNKPGWAIGREGMRQLRGRSAKTNEAATASTSVEGEGTATLEEPEPFDDEESNEQLAEEFAAIDAVLQRSRAVLDGLEVAPKPAPTAERDSLIYDLDWNEDERLAEWRAVQSQTEDMPIVLRAAVLNDAWHEIEVLQHASWLGPLFIAAQLRQTGMTVNHLACLHVGARKIPRERRRARDWTERLLAFVDAVHEAADAGLMDHDRLMLAREQMERRLTQRRSSSKLPQLVDLVLARPLVSTSMIQKEFKVTRQGALNLITEFNLREITGRGRYRAWGVI